MTEQMEMEFPVPTFADVLAARDRIRPYLPVTPLHRYPALDALVGAAIYIKHENYQPVGAFKVRGGINLVSQMTADERRRGVIAASTGNHGQSVAYASRLFGVTARIVVPEGANPGKVAAMQGMGAEVIFHGATFDEARLHCEDLAVHNGYRYIHSGNEPLLIAGVGTEALEMIEAEPSLDLIIVPVGGGSGAAGACLAAQGTGTGIRVVGVQAEKAPAAYEAWRRGIPMDIPSATKAEGLATGVSFVLPQAIMAKGLSDFILVSEREISEAMVALITHAHTLPEAAGASSLAAALRLREAIKGLRVGLVLSGGNVSVQQLRQVLASGQED